MRDDGTTGNPIIEVNQSNDPNIRNLPTLRHANVALNTANLGRKFTFQLAVYNREGETKSVAVAYLFATKPVAPSQPPVVMQYDSKKATVSYLFQDSNGCSSFLSYHLMYIDSYSGHWIDLAGKE